MNIKAFTAAMKKECWEFNKIFTWIPAIIASLVITVPLLTLIANDVPYSNLINELKTLPENLLIPGHYDFFPKIIFMMLTFLFLPFIIVAGIVQLYYFTACLFDERRDLSVIFWRSLPVSDLNAILVKLITGTLLIPGIFLLAATLTALLIGVLFFVICVIFSLTFDISLWGFWAHSGVLTSLSLIWITILPYSLWMLPLFTWLMLMSMYANKAPILWATLPLIAIFLVEGFFVHYLRLSQPLLFNTVFEYFAITEEVISNIQPTSDMARDTILKIVSSKVSIASVIIPAGLLYATYWLRVNRSEA